LTDLIATGARLIEPDMRVMRGALYSPPSGALRARTCDQEPHTAGQSSFVVASAETLAYAVSTGEIGDPRSFKRPVRVTVPRALPTDDVLVTRRGEKPLSSAVVGRKLDGAGPAWRAAQTLELVDPSFA